MVGDTAFAVGAMAFVWFTPNLIFPSPKAGW
jgi:hypothetical protein